ncbi:MAG TPA: hypothetical protein VNI83_05480 [Vicinamibacterales bacterium]|nr:hypothetical protein [Vicinamibacterales bacterium]
MTAEEYRERRDALEGWPVTIVSYRLGQRYVCAVHNADPGARIAVADAATREEAEARALEDARRRLARTRRR